MSKKKEQPWHYLHDIVCTYTIIRPNGGAIRSSGSPDSVKETIMALAKEYMEVTPELLENLIEYFEI